MTVYFGKPTLADLIITHAGLQRLLLEYAKLELNETLKNEFLTQGMICRQNLETILAGLPFNLPCTFDYVLALYMAVSANPQTMMEMVTDVLQGNVLSRQMPHITLLEHTRRRSPNVPTPRPYPRNPPEARNTRRKTAQRKTSIMDPYDRQDALHASQPSVAYTCW